MAITLSTAARNAACDAVVDLVDVGAGTAVLRIQTAADATLCDINLSATAFGAASNGVATASGLPLSGTASGTGTAAKYRVLDKDGTEVWQGTVTATGGDGDLELATVSIASGITINVTSWTHTAPA